MRAGGWSSLKILFQFGVSQLIVMIKVENKNDVIEFKFGVKLEVIIDWIMNKLSFSSDQLLIGL